MRRVEVQAHSASRPGHFVCPVCGIGQLQPRGLLARMADCDFCECAFDSAIVSTLKQIVALPDGFGTHPCECGHPEMRFLPGGIFHCPACRSEVLPA